MIQSLSVWNNYDILMADKVFDMNQQKTIQLLETIMPDIVSSGNPGDAMLKCATAHNLAPAQLEKLAQVFNTMKTNYFMDHQANRGDSFPLVNVPELMTKYATYTPEVETAAPSMESSWSETFKYASSEKDDKPTLADIWKAAGGAVQEDSDTWSVLDVPAPHYDVQFKSAAVAEVAQMPTKEQLQRAYDNANQARFESSCELREKLANLKKQFTPDNGRWAQAVEDTMFGLGKEAAVAINLVEDYFEQEGHKFKGANLAKRAGANVLVHDRHGVWKDMKDICDLVEMQKEAKQLMAELGAHIEKYAYPKPPPGNKQQDPNLPKATGIKKVLPEAKTDLVKLTVTNPVNDAVALVENPTMKDMVAAILAPTRPISKEETAWKKDKMQQAKREVTLQQLLASDKILQEADPRHVQELYDTIANISPTLAGDPRLMGPTLKEALQYDAIPMQMLKDLVSMEKDQGTRAKDKLTLDRA